MGNFYISEILNCQGLTTDHAQLKLAAASYLADSYQLKKGQAHYFNDAAESFSIDEVRRLQWESQHYSSFAKHDELRALVLLGFDSAGEPAQNAALKIIEESPPATLLLLVVNDTAKLLPTITSRCKQINWQVASTNQPASNSPVSWPTSYAQAVELASEYKERPLAQAQLSMMQADCDDSAWEKKSILLAAQQALAANANVLLTLEHCFFDLVTSERQPAEQPLK